MKYLIRQRVFSLRDSFTIKNEYGEDCFMVYGKIFSLGNKLHLTDLQGRELYYIEQRVFRLLPEYTIYQNGVPVAQVKKNFTLFRPSFDISSVYGNYNIDGNFFAYDFTIFKNGSPVAVISKKWFSFSDTYGVSIDDNEDAAFLLALVIVLDQVYHDGDNK
ncbi:MAG TPA: LURP-one-related family protein [Thermoclostridium sp.]